MLLLTLRFLFILFLPLIRQNYTHSFNMLSILSLNETPEQDFLKPKRRLSFNPNFLLANLLHICVEVSNHKNVHVAIFFKNELE